MSPCEALRDAGAAHLLHPGDPCTRCGRSCARAERLGAAGAVGSRTRRVRARRLAGRHGLSAALRPLAGRQMVRLLRAEALVDVGRRIDVHRRIPPAVVHRARRVGNRRHMDERRPVRRRPRAMDASRTGRGGSRSPSLSIRARAAARGDVRQRTGTRLDRDRGHTGTRSARYVGREAHPARDDAERTSRGRRRRAHRWWSVRRVPRQPQLHPEVWYALEREDTLETLEGVQWADWDGSGRMLVATTDRRLQVRGAEGPDSAVSWEVDLSADEPDPQPPPDEARRW